MAVSASAQDVAPQYQKSMQVEHSNLLPAQTLHCFQAGREIWVAPYATDIQVHDTRLSYRDRDATHTSLVRIRDGGALCVIRDIPPDKDDIW